MRRFIFLGLLACVHGLSDTFPDANPSSFSFKEALQVTGKGWNDICLTGKKQSPIDIKDAAVPKKDPGAIMAYGFDVDVPMHWMVDG